MTVYSVNKTKDQVFKFIHILYINKKYQWLCLNKQLWLGKQFFCTMYQQSYKYRCPLYCITSNESICHDKIYFDITGKLTALLAKQKFKTNTVLYVHVLHVHVILSIAKVVCINRILLCSSEFKHMIYKK